MAFPGYILRAKAREYYWEGQAELSIKTFSSGRALYTLEQGLYAVDDSSYFIVNHQQSYAIAIEAEEPVESFCLFFQPGFAEEVHRSLSTPLAPLLNEPIVQSYTPLNFFERTYPYDHLLLQTLSRLRATIDSPHCEPALLEDAAYDIMRYLLCVHLSVFEEIEALPAIRFATREELYRRLYKAREYMLACFDQPLTIDKMASIATLSPTHFLRVFKQIFHCTPHQYLIAIRLEKAQQLLIKTNQSVTDICFALGFESPGSFSWLFHQRIGCSPTMYRATKR